MPQHLQLTTWLLLSCCFHHAVSSQNQTTLFTPLNLGKYAFLWILGVFLSLCLLIHVRTKKDMLKVVECCVLRSRNPIYSYNKELNHFYMKLLHGHSEIEIKFDTDNHLWTLEWWALESQFYQNLQLTCSLSTLIPSNCPKADYTSSGLYGSSVFGPCNDKVKLRNTFSPSFPPGSHSVFIVVILKKY